MFFNFHLKLPFCQAGRKHEHWAFLEFFPHLPSYVVPRCWKGCTLFLGPLPLSVREPCLGVRKPFFKIARVWIFWYNAQPFACWVTISLSPHSHPPIEQTGREAGHRFLLSRPSLLILPPNIGQDGDERKKMTFPS